MTVIPDTNLVVRLLTQDDPGQFQQAKQIFAHGAIRIPTTVVLETEWVLRYAYRFEAPAIFEAFHKLFGLPNVTLAETNRVALAMEWSQAGLDFADGLHLAALDKEQQFVTFDKKLITRARKVTSLQIVSPEEVIAAE